MKKYQFFLERYTAIENENERLAFMRGYMINLSPKQFQAFFDFNTKNGISAVQEIGISELLDNLAIQEIEQLARKIKAKFELQSQAA